MAENVITRIVATARLLTALQVRTFDDGEEFKTASRMQRRSIAELIAGMTFTSTEAASIAEALATVPFAGPDATALMALASEALSSTSVDLSSLPIGRRPQQDYRPFTNFLPQ